MAVATALTASSFKTNIGTVTLLMLLLAKADYLLQR
jgi:hypothetical protein